MNKKITSAAFLSLFFAASAQSTTSEFHSTQSNNSNNSAVVIANFSTLVNNVNTNTINIESNTTKINTNQSDISNNSTSIIRNSNNIASSSTSIAANSNNIATNSANIANLPTSDEFNSLSSRVTQLEQANTGQILVLTSENFHSYTDRLLGGKYALIQGKVTITEETDNTLYGNGNSMISGGQFEGVELSNNGTKTYPTLNFGSGALVYGATFKNLNLAGIDSCINCTFLDNIGFGNNIKIELSRINSVTETSTTSRIEAIANSWIVNSTLNDVLSIHSTEIKDSTLNYVDRLTNNEIGDSIVKVSDLATNNQFEDSTLDLSSSEITVANNIFDKKHSSRSETILLVRTGSVMIANNVFNANSSDPVHISIAENTSSSRQYISIKNNQFIKAENVLNVDNTVAKIIVKDNEIFDSSLNYSGSYVIDNLSL